MRPEPSEASRKRHEKTVQVHAQGHDTQERRRIAGVPGRSSSCSRTSRRRLPDAKTPIPTIPTETETIAPMTESLIPYVPSILGTTMPIENLNSP